MICVRVSLTILSLFTTMTSIGLTGSIGNCDIIILTFRRFTSSTALYNNCKKVIADSFTKKKILANFTWAVFKWVSKNQNQINHNENSKKKQAICLKRGKTRVTKLGLALVLQLIGRGDGTSFLDQLSILSYPALNHLYSDTSCV